MDRQIVRERSLNKNNEEQQRWTARVKVHKQQVEQLRRQKKTTEYQTEESSCSAQKLRRMTMRALQIPHQASLQCDRSVCQGKSHSKLLW